MITANGNMEEKKNNHTLMIAIIVSIVVVAFAAVIAIEYFSQPSYWTLNIDASPEWNVNPNGTIQVSANQESINVTVKKAPFGACGYWRLDGSNYNSFEDTVTIPKQAAGSNHTLKVIWVTPTPALIPIVNGETRINAGDYQAYNFTAPENMKSSIVVDVNASSSIKVYVIDEANFDVWKNTKTAQYILRTGANATVNYLSLLSEGVYYLVLDNTSGQNTCTVSANATLQYTPKTLIVVHG
jgi:hypothetical protein